MFLFLQTHQAQFPNRFKFLPRKSLQNHIQVFHSRRVKVCTPAIVFRKSKFEDTMLSTNSNNWFPTNKLKPIQSTLYWCLYELRTKFSSKHGYVIYSITLQTKTLKHVRIRYSILIDACRRKCRKAIGKYKTLPAKHSTANSCSENQMLSTSQPAVPLASFYGCGKPLSTKFYGQ